MREENISKCLLSGKPSGEFSDAEFLLQNPSGTWEALTSSAAAHFRTGCEGNVDADGTRTFLHQRKAVPLSVSVLLKMREKVKAAIRSVP